MRYERVQQGAIVMLIMGFAAIGWSRCGYANADLPKPAVDLPAGKPGETRSIVVAGGCFWCIEGVFQQLKGVTGVVSGYAGGTKETASYETVCSGRTNHAESVKITYDPSQISLGEILRVFFTVHDPTTRDRQGPDTGRQYRSAIFFENDDQKRVAEAYTKQLTDAKIFEDPIVTTLEPLTGFYPAEDYHQSYAKLHPNEPYICQIAQPKIKKVREKFPDEVKPEK